MKTTPVDDDRVSAMIGTLEILDDGFANFTIYRSELLALLREVERDRAKPLHCPCCDGDHL